MTEFSLHDFLLITKEVIAFQSGGECDRINSLVVVDDKFDFETDYLKAKSNAPYYFSRDEKRITFPSLVFNINGDSLSSFKNKIFQDYCHSLELGIVDQKHEECTKCPDCHKRNSEQIFIDEGHILRKLINTMANYAMFHTVNGLVETDIYHYKPIMDLKVAEGIYDSYKEVTHETELYRNTFKSINTSVNMNNVVFNRMNLLGKFANIQVCDICPENETIFTYKLYKGCC